MSTRLGQVLWIRLDGDVRVDVREYTVFSTKIGEIFSF